MKWEYLTPLPAFEFLSSTLRKRVDTVNGNIESLRTERQKIDARIDQSHKSPIGEVDLDNIVMIPNIRDSIISLLQLELTLRNEIDGLLDAIQSERVPAIEKARETHGRVQEDVKAALVSIGYVDAGPYEQARGKISWPRAKREYKRLAGERDY